MKNLDERLLNEWNYEKNGDLKPESFRASSRKKVWWKCLYGHVWEDTIYHRCQGMGCPYDMGKKIFNVNDISKGLK